MVFLIKLMRTRRGGLNNNARWIKIFSQKIDHFTPQLVGLDWVKDLSKFGHQNPWERKVLQGMCTCLPSLPFIWHCWKEQDVNARFHVAWLTVDTLFGNIFLDLPPSVERNIHCLGSSINLNFYSQSLSCYLHPEPSVFSSVKWGVGHLQGTWRCAKV